MIQLSTERINERSPYRVELADEMSCLFTNKYGVRYSVGFVSDPTFLDDGVYQFFIYNIDHHREAEDPLVSETIKVIIEEFFSQGQNVMLYICDTMDNRQATRNRLFKMWFMAYLDNQSYTMFNEHLQVDNITYFASIILRKDHPEHNKIIGTFHDFVQGLPEKWENM